MVDSPLTILGVFAHPDDEIGTGSTLARYGDAGILTVLACATRGEAATIYCDDCATHENLAEVRTRELQCACEQLGVAELRWLDWPDGRINELPRSEAVGQVVALIREIQPDVIITHPEDGLYPHPDHLAVWEIVRAAFDGAADPEQYPESGAPWAASRLFTRALPQSFFDAAPGLAQQRVQLNGQQLPFHATPDEHIDAIMHVAPWADRRMAAWDCHRSQHNPRGAFAQLPDALRRDMAENEHFVLAAARVPLPKNEAEDLLAGLNHAAVEPAPTGDYLAALRAELAIHRALVVVYQDYLHTSGELGLTLLLPDAIEREQESVRLLATALRRAGEGPGEVAPEAKLRSHGMRRRDSKAQLQFLESSTQRAVAAYEAYAKAESDDAQGATWAELAELAAAQQAALQALTH